MVNVVLDILSHSKWVRSKGYFRWFLSVQLYTPHAFTLTNAGGCKSKTPVYIRNAQVGVLSVHTETF